MNIEEASQTVDETFHRDFERIKFAKFIRKLLHQGLDTSENFPSLLTNVQGDFRYKYHERIESYEKIGTYADSLDILIVKLRRNVTLQRGRTTLRDFAADYATKGQRQRLLKGVLIAFYSEGDVSWRFSYVKIDASLIIDENGNIKDSIQKSEAKRYSFLVGRNEQTHTAQKQFIPLLTAVNSPKVDDIEKAFSIEVVTDAFFTDYDRIFKKVEKEIARSIPDTKPNDKEAEEKRRLFTQRLFNRLMFINFLQKKGWLSYEGDTNYLRRLFTEAEKSNENFFDDRLFWLFFSGLNASINEDLHKSKKLEERRGVVPPLNGGLFEKDEDGFDEREKIKIDNSYFGEILDLFELYNFTVDESTPTDIEVAVDPEMLGRVFEELVTGRHESGSYYTPRPIVSFMCRESLKYYLAPYDTKETIDEFVDEGKGGNLRDARAILDALENIRVCDPACGSGAYLLGMMQELLRLREAVFVSKNLGSGTIYKRKREIIENNIYGVDIDRFAVQIASLRLWLSLSIDSDEPRPLPNLKYKIGCGDSLLAPMENDLQSNLLRRPLIERFKELKKEYSGTNKPELKNEIDGKIEHIRTEIAQSLHHLPEPPKPQLIILAENNLQPLRDKVVNCIKIADKPQAEKFQKELNKLELRIEEWKQQLEPSHYKPQYFDWTVEFAEVFVDGGFDIVLANPPYVRHTVLGRDYKENKLKPNYKDVFSSLADLYVYFFARAQQLLKPSGVGSFISSNKWLQQEYGEKLRQHLLDKEAFHLVVDFGELPVFKSVAAYTAVFLWQKLARKEIATNLAVIDDLERCYTEGLRECVSRISKIIPASQFSKNKSRLITSSKKSSMEANGQPLGEIASAIFVGLQTSADKIYILDFVNEASPNHILLHSKETGSNYLFEKSLVKPILSGADVKRYQQPTEKQYVIFPYEIKNNTVAIYEEGELQSKFPFTFEYLNSNKNKLEGRENGKMKGNGWFGYVYLKNMTKQESIKLCVPRLVSRIQTIFDKKGRFYLDNVDVGGVILKDKTEKNYYYILALLNSELLTWYLKQISTPFRGGFYSCNKQYLTRLPIPNASENERESIVSLAKETQSLHTERRAKVEQFLIDVGTSPTESSSRNILEKPWELSEADFIKRTKSEPLLPTFRHVKDETFHLTEQTLVIEHEIDQRVAELYGVKLEI